MRALLVTGFLLCLLTGYRSHGQDMVVNVELKSRTTSFAVIPDETSSLSVVSDFQLFTLTPSLVLGAASDLELFQLSDCKTGVCSINVTSGFSAPEVSVIFQFSTRSNEVSSQNLTVSVRTSLNYSCQTYPSPLPFAASMSYPFTCKPPSGLNVSSVIWRRFRSQEEVEQFQAGMNFASEVISASTNLTLNGTLNETLQVGAREDAVFVAYFYVPSFEVTVQSTTVEIRTAETSVYVVPEITTAQPEFSLEVKLNRRSYDEIRCATKSFPPANVVWTLQSEDYPGGIDVSTLVNGTFALDSLGSLDSLTLTKDGVINMTNLQYDDDGNFTCVCSNRYGSSAQWTRLRIKSPLRPLWPALGILGVTILVTIFMAGSTVVEKISEKHKRARISKCDTSSIDHTAEQGHELASVSHKSKNGNNYANNSKGKDSSHSAIKRLSSAKPLLEETTTTL